MQANELRKEITEQIIKALESGNLPPWRKPWANDPNAPGLHTSLSTAHAYKGINQLLLQVSATRHGFKSKWWGTFNQVKASGGYVCRGQKATKIILWKPISRKRTNDEGEEVDDDFLVMREFFVFNAEQTSGLNHYQVGFAQPKEDAGERREHADIVIEATGADIRYGGKQSLLFDRTATTSRYLIRQQFESPETFYETVLHELCHWTEKRVGFDRSQAENTYALGELVAEVGSCILMAELGLPTTTNLTNHAAYLKGWLKAMKGDPNFIFRASSEASKAADFILAFKLSAQPQSATAE